MCRGGIIGRDAPTKGQARNVFLMILDATSNRLYRAKPRAPPPPNSGQSAPGHLALAHAIFVRHCSFGALKRVGVKQARAWHPRPRITCEAIKICEPVGFILVVLVDAWALTCSVRVGVAAWERARSGHILKMIPIDNRLM